MEREKSKFDILKRILDERNRRGWNEYTLAQRSGLTQSTISTWYRKGLQPSVASIERICDGLGISLAQFFMDYAPGDTVKLSKDQAELLMLYNKLTEEQAAALVEMLKTFVNE